MSKRRAKKWIQGAHLRRGALHRKLHVPEGKSIPVSLLKRAARAFGRLGREARFALTARKFKHRKVRHRQTR